MARDLEVGLEEKRKNVLRALKDNTGAFSGVTVSRSNKGGQILQIDPKSFIRGGVAAGRYLIITAELH